MFVGPSGSGKLTQARKWIEEAHGTSLKDTLESRTFQVGDGYEARVLVSPFHFEIDIPNLSMQDKQIIGDLLTTFFSSRDVLSSLRSSTRKLVILRRAHSLSLPAAIRVRAILQQYVMPPDVTGMIWITAREVTGSLALLEDTFVRHRIPRLSLETWCGMPDIPDFFRNQDTWEKCEGRPERAREILKFFPDGNIPSWPRRIQDFYDDMMKIIIQQAKLNRPPNIDIIVWIRGRIYQALSLCQAGPDIIDSCAAAIIRQHMMLEDQVFWKVMTSLTKVEPHTSYRTPLSLESGILDIFETIRKYTGKKEEIPHGAVPTSRVEPTPSECTESAETQPEPKKQKKPRAEKQQKQPKEPKQAKPKESKESKEPKEPKEPKQTKPKEPKEPKQTKEPKEPKPPKPPKPPKEPKPPKQTKEPKEPKPPKQPKEPKPPKQPKQPKEPEESKEPKQPKQPKEPKERKERKEPKSKAKTNSAPPAETPDGK